MSSESSSSSPPSLSLPPKLLQKTLQQLAESKETFIHRHIDVGLHLGGNYDISIRDFSMGRSKTQPTTEDDLRMVMGCQFRLGTRTFHYGVTHTIREFFYGNTVRGSESDALVVVQDGIKALFSQVRNICSSCLEYRSKDQMDIGAKTCDRCELKDAMAKFLPEVEQKQVTLGLHQENVCAICTEPFLPTSVVVKTNQCQHIFHLTCFCNMKESRCPLCKTYFSRFQRVGDIDEWQLIDNLDDEHDHDHHMHIHE